MDEHGVRARSTPVSARGLRGAVLVAGEETEGRFALVETVEVRGSEPPSHLHHREDVALYVLNGAVDVWVAGRWSEAPAGAAVFVPRHVEHAFVVTTGVARVLTLFVPAGFEGFYREVGAAGLRHPDAERLVTAAARYGCEIAGPAPATRGPSVASRWASGS